MRVLRTMWIKRLIDRHSLSRTRDNIWRRSPEKKRKWGKKSKKSPNKSNLSPLPLIKLVGQRRMQCLHTKGCINSRIKKYCKSFWDPKPQPIILRGWVILHLAPLHLNRKRKMLKNGEETICTRMQWDVRSFRKKWMIILQMPKNILSKTKSKNTKLIRILINLSFKNLSENIV